MSTQIKQGKIPAKIGEKWLKALRSGKYNQSTSFLYTSNGWCCLGVLGHVCGIPKDRLYEGYWLMDLSDKPDFSPSTGYKLTNEDIKLIPQDFVGSDLENKLIALLSGMNDKKKYSFQEIADWIEENIEFVKEEDEVSIT